MNLTVIVTKEATSDGKVWLVAQAIEKNIAVQAETLDELKQNFDAVLGCLIETALERNEEPFERLKSAPRGNLPSRRTTTPQARRAVRPKICLAY